MSAKAASQRRPKILISGAGGYVGQRLVATARERAELLLIGRQRQTLPEPAEGLSVLALDILDAAALKTLCADWQPDAIIHAAAANPGQPLDTLMPVNETGSANMAEVAAHTGARLVFLSSDSLYNGRDGKAPYDDDATPAPLTENLYGCSKAAAERAIFSRCPDAVALRCSLIFGLHAIDRSTAGFIARLNRGEPLELFEDVLRQPIGIDAVVAALLTLALEQTTVAGTLNFGGAEVWSRLDFGRVLLEYWSALNENSELRAVSAASLPGVPLDVRMNCTRAAAIGLEMPGVSVVLKARS